ILMQTRQLSEDEAYNLMREQAMAKRVTTESIADAVIKASEILSFAVEKKIGS
ncbi:MAG: ANTAR domain-containing protein, partial [Betaproteobacteria bacterium]|nr:ANTAR domain-containing protein [Betaproteobacteria bacterium]